MRNQLLVFLFTGWAIGVPASAQPSHTGGGGTGTGNPGTIGGTRTPTRPTFPGSDSNSVPDLNRSALYLSGKVSMDDGTPPPDLVVIQLICGTAPRSLGYTDGKGRFSVNVRDRNNDAGLDDASEQGSFGRGTNDFGVAGTGQLRGQSTLNACELRAELAGFRSDTVNLFDRKTTDNPDVGTIFLHRRANVEGLTISATTAMAPPNARKAFQKGREEEKKGKSAEAQRQFQKAVDEYPKFAAAWYELGRTQEALNDNDAARKSYEQALAADSKFVSPYDRLAGLAATQRNWQEVVDDTSHLLRLNPVDFPRAWYSNAFANFQLQNIEAAEKSAESGITADSAHRIPQLKYLLGVILAQKQDYAGAVENMRAYIALAPKAPDIDKVKQQLADIEKLTQAKQE
jgi:tetratricopeptide (TPR) repeat protein